MKYPKQIMTTSELTQLGFSKNYLIQMYHVKNQNYARKTKGGKKIYWDVEKFEKHRLKCD